MDKKEGNIIERHIEKAVLAAAGLVCAFILVKYVALSPNVFRYDNKTFAAGQLDRYIEEQADKIKMRLEEGSVVRQQYEPNEPRFKATMDCPVNIGATSRWPVPSSVELKMERKYRIPAIGEVKDVAVDWIRAAAYVPKVEITAENANDDKAYEPNDLDLVTVQGSFDIAALRESFQSCFAGREIAEEWRDTSLAKPVFAAVQLQRQSMGTDGQWGTWENVGRTRTEPYTAEFIAIEDVNELPSGGVMVRLLKLSDPKTQVSLLQPEPYQIASAEEEWLPPVQHKKFVTATRDREAQERRDTIAEQRQVREDELDKARQERKSSRDAKTPGREPTGRGGGGGGGMGGGDYMKMIMGGGSSSSSRNPSRSTPERERQRRPETTTDETKPKVTKPDPMTEIDNEMKKITLQSKDFAKLTEAIVFWAHDDSVMPGKNYRYRIRLGVFNPVAGTGQIVADDQPYNNKAILWTKYSDVTETIAIPERMYFFPVNVQEQAKAVDVQVCRYALGYWHSEQFMVKRGEVIGKQMAVEPNEELTLPVAIDYSTGAVLVDMVAMNDWTGDKNLTARHYFDVLYSFDGVNMMRVASKLMNWPEDMRTRYNEIKTLEKKPKQAFKTWGSARTVGGRTLPGVPSRTGGRGSGAPMTGEEYMEMLRGGRPQQ